MSHPTSRKDFDIQATSQLPVEQLVAIIAEQQRVIDRLSQERDGLQFKLRLDNTAESLLGQVKGVGKELYRMLLNRLTERMYRRLIQEVYGEMNRINLQHVDFQTQLTQQVADEFALMHRMIDSALNQNVAVSSTAIPTETRAFDPLVAEKLRRVEALLGYTEYRVDFDPQLPQKTSRFPLKSLTRGLQDTYSKFINYLFKEQRQVNINLLQALQQSSLVNQQLADQVSALQERLDHLSRESTPFQAPGQPDETLSHGSETENGFPNPEVLLNSLDS